MVGDRFGGFGVVDIFVENVLDADAGAFDADIVVGEKGEVVSEGGVTGGSR